MIKLRSGDNFAGCTIIDICGKGGCGTVYLAEDAAGQRVAVKIINTNDTERELRGIKNYMPFSHNSPHLLPIFHVGVEQDELFIVMKAADRNPISPYYLPDTLAGRLKLNGKIPPDEALDIIRKIANALKILHDAKLIHRDIKPDNIIFVNGQPMLSDPGLICSTEYSITLIGTLGFLPPECFSGAESNSVQSDIYALGKLFYCMVTGEAPGRFPYLPPELSFAVSRKLLPILLRSCNTKKKKRYDTVDEFLRDLPKRLPRPGILQQINEKFRIWRLMHHNLWNLSLAGITAAIMLGSGWMWHLHRQDLQHQATLAGYAAETGLFQNEINKSADVLSMQLETLLGEKTGHRTWKNYSSLPADPAAAVKLSRRYRRELNAHAVRTAEKNKSIPDTLNRVAVQRAFLRSPLGGFLTESQRSALRSELSQIEKANPRIFGNRIKLEKLFRPDFSGLFEFAYIPPGEFKSPVSGKRSRIDYPLWVLNEKLTFRQFSRICNFNPPKSQDQEAPAVRFLWNDIINGCRKANLNFPGLSKFPPGYIVRPLTAEEWEYCASRNNSTGAKKSNSFGLTGIGNDIYEMVCDGTYDYADSVIAMSCDKKMPRKEFAYFQSFMKNVGIRIAIAPGSPDFYLQSFKSTTPQHFVHSGKHYEFFGHLVANFSRKNAENICRMLGGRLASIDSSELLAKVNRYASPIVKYNICVAADFKNGKWMWANGKAVQNPPPPPKTDEVFSMERGEFKSHTLNRFLGFVCEWTEEEFRNRSNWKKRPKDVTPDISFTIGGREYALFHAGLNYHHINKRFAEILGGRIAEPESPELLAEIIKKTEAFSGNPILLGGYSYNDKFLWNTSKNQIRQPMPPVGHMIDPSPSLLAPALHQGKLCVTQRTNLFLVEFPEQPSAH